MRLHSNRERPFHLGALALEKVPRADAVAEPAQVAQPDDAAAPTDDSLHDAMAPYRAILHRHLDGRTLGARAAAESPAAARARRGT